jgi:abhydrolase domain-containing protein 12
MTGISIFKASLKHVFKIFLLINILQIFFSLTLVLYPPMQNMFIYVNWLSLTFGNPIEPPESYGPFTSCHTSPSNAFHINEPLRLMTPDGHSLGAWHFMLKEACTGRPCALDEDSPFILYFHGNASTRALFYQVETYKSLLTAYPKSQMLAIDYRGFGDSEGNPTETGLLTDALTAWKYIIETLKGFYTRNIFHTDIFSAIAAHINSRAFFRNWRGRGISSPAREVVF